jgi:primosomal protein N' (replication factor Y)
VEASAESRSKLADTEQVDATTTNQASRPQFVEVAVPVHVGTTFTYRLPEPLQEVAQRGSRIVVPLARKLVTGYIVELLDQLRPGTSLKESDLKDAKEILDAIPLVTPELLELTRWVSDYYLAPLGEVIKAALPPGITPRMEQFLSLTDTGRAALHEASGEIAAVLVKVAEVESISLTTLQKQSDNARIPRLVREMEREGLIEIAQRRGGEPVKAKYQRHVRLTPSADQPEQTGRKLTETQQRVIETLRSETSLPFTELLARAGVGPSSVDSLRKRNVVEVFEVRQLRDPLSHVSLERHDDYVLTEEQRRVLADIEQPLRSREYAAFLLHGVTGSGKTEVYIRSMRVALSLGRSALMLVPEIALTPVFSRRLRMHFGNRVAIFHSSLSRGERFDEWSRVRSGEARVVIGTRSAVFAPTKDLGLVIVDEEHESTYRQQDSPHYNGRDTAIVRAQREGAVVVLGSATPSLETFYNSKHGKYRYLQLPSRLANRPMAETSIVDMREVFKRSKKPKIFSEELLNAISETHAKGEQSIVLLNRRGYSSFVLCRSCGESIQCPNCEVTLTYHRTERVLICHYCNHREAAPNSCPNCEGKYIYYVGEGTQQIEEQLRKLFPELRIARIDRDTASKRGEFETSLLDFGAGKIDMLVGTQILAKGHDFPNVTLVGVVSVDAGMALPDFRSAERTFQLLTQVAGRAGRGDRPGKVLIQTYHPYHYALRHASAQDYASFYEEESRHRQNHNYPPFVSLASLLVHGAELPRVRNDANELRKELDQANAERLVRILGPAPAPLSRLKGEYRIQLLLKCRNRRELRRVIDQALSAVADRKVNLRGINVEIDPVSIM